MNDNQEIMTLMIHPTSGSLVPDNAVRTFMMHPTSGSSNHGLVRTRMLEPTSGVNRSSRRKTPEVNSMIGNCNRSSFDEVASVVHHNIVCDNCGITPIVGIRYRCEFCPDYDLCGSCFNKNAHSFHSFQAKRQSQN
jgi:hypothetical protein